MAEVTLADAGVRPAGEPVAAPAADPAPYVRREPDGRAGLNLVVENIHCPACIRTIESTLQAIPGVCSARMNLTTRRLAVTWKAGRADGADIVAALAARGYRARPFDPEKFALLSDRQDKELLRAVAVAGFAAANVMLLSISVWAGLGDDMGPATRTLFHWISAMIALPAVAYAGRPFFRSAWAAARRASLNMDVPISVAVLLAAAMSLYQTTQGGDHVYFDASVTLLFFLLVGRYLDQRVRTRAGFAAQNLLAMRAVAATVVEPSGRRRSLPIEAVRPGMVVAVAAGERVPVDGRVTAGRSDVDTSLVTGESVPRPVAANDQVFAGTLNLGAPLTIAVEAAEEETLLAEIVRLMENAEQGRARHLRLADRVARVYAPAVHLLGAATFVAWLALGGVDWEVALMNAIAVLIVTCPCALGLAVPAVQVVACGRLLRGGILVKAADGLERLAEVDRVVFDKTGSLTLGRPELVNADRVPDDALRLAASLAAASRHPLARALARAAGEVAAAAEVREVPGMGLAAQVAGAEIRLGNREWCGIPDKPDSEPEEGGPELWLARPGTGPVQFRFHDRIRPDARETLRRLAGQGLAVEILSGDRADAVRRTAAELAVDCWQAEVRPDGKIARLAALAGDGHRVLMVGDGLNDAPALAAAHASVSPASAADVSQTAADFVFQGEGLAAVAETLEVARRARRLVFQNFALAFLYNAVAVPLAMAGLLTPLIAALAMSASSVAVTSNALRLAAGRMGSAAWMR